MLRPLAAASARPAPELLQLVLLSPSENAIKLADELGGIGIQGSVTEVADLERLAEVALDRYGRLDAVVNNTGHGPGSTSPTGRRFDPNADANLLEISDDEWRETFEIYYLNIVRMSRIVTPIFEKQQRGAIVNISATAAKEPSYAYPGSSTMRMAVAGFCKLYSDKYARDGIRMNNILPGFLSNWEWPEALLASIPMGRAGELAELANTVAFLLSDEASYITGQEIVVDGGMIRQI